MSNEISTPIKRKAGKEPMRVTRLQYLDEDEEEVNSQPRTEELDDDVAARPSLHQYFEELGTADAIRIKMCSAYASYLRSIQPPALKRNRKLVEK